MTADHTPRGATDTRQGPRWALFAIITSTLAVLCSAYLLLSSIPWENDRPASHDALSWDGLTAMLSTLLSAGIAGAVAAWVLTAQNKKQAELQRAANTAQQEEARKAREIQAAADLAEHIDTKWHLFIDVEDLNVHLGATHIPVEEIPHLRRLTNIWTAHLRDDLIEQAGGHRGSIRRAILKYAEALEWSGLHHDHRPITSQDPHGVLHDPKRTAWEAQKDLLFLAHFITDMPCAPDEYSIESLQKFLTRGNAYGQFTFHVQRPPRTTPGLDT